MSKKVVIVSNFHEDIDVSRSLKAFYYFKSKGFDVEVLYSDFSHSLKCFRNINLPNHKKIRTISYSSNISIRRVISHFIYTFKVLSFLRNKEIDIIYVIYPPNVLSLIILFGSRKIKKIIVDVIDLWPEAFMTKKRSIKNLILSPVYFISSYFRYKSLSLANACLTESDYFSRILEFHKFKLSRVLYLSKSITENSSFNNISDELSIAYLGNIGHVYDFDSLFVILSEVQKHRKVSLHIIGAGPLKEWLLERLKIIGIQYRYYGSSFDEKFKKNTLSSCWFGFNGYKVGYDVALSYKTIDYLSFGIPLINSALEDTVDFVDRDKIGFNFLSKDLNPIIKKLSKISLKDISLLKRNAYKTFEKKFSTSTYNNIMDNVLDGINE